MRPALPGPAVVRGAVQVAVVLVPDTLLARAPHRPAVNVHQHPAVRESEDLAVGAAPANVRDVDLARFRPGLASVLRTSDPGVDRLVEILVVTALVVIPGCPPEADDQCAVFGLSESRVAIIHGRVNDSRRPAPGLAFVCGEDDVEPAFDADMRRATAQDNCNPAVLKAESDGEIALTSDYQRPFHGWMLRLGCLRPVAGKKEGNCRSCCTKQVVVHETPLAIGRSITSAPVTQEGANGCCRRTLLCLSLPHGPINRPPHFAELPFEVREIVQIVRRLVRIGGREWLQ